MKNIKIVRNALSTLLAASLAFTLVGCGKKQTAEIKTMETVVGENSNSLIDEAFSKKITITNIDGDSVTVDVLTALTMLESAIDTHQKIQELTSGNDYSNITESELIEKSLTEDEIEALITSLEDNKLSEQEKYIIKGKLKHIDKKIESFITITGDDILEEAIKLQIKSDYCEVSDLSSDEIDCCTIKPRDPRYFGEGTDGKEKSAKIIFEGDKEIESLNIIRPSTQFGLYENLINIQENSVPEQYKSKVEYNTEIFKELKEIIYANPKTEKNFIYSGTYISSQEKEHELEEKIYIR